MVRARAGREAESGTERRRENRRARKKREEKAETQKQSDKGVEVQKSGEKWNKRKKCTRKEILSTAQVRKKPTVGIERP
jgi:hypothetical protein